MWIAFIPVVFWALGSVCSSRSAYLLGPAATNRWRLTVAVTVLGAWVLLKPGVPRHGAAWGWLLVSGAVGLGLGDLAMLAGYRRIGPRITVLLLLCLAVPVSGVTEWLWLGTRIGWREALLCGLLLCGVALAVLPGAHLPARDRRAVAAGLGWGVLAAVGQGLSTTLSRAAYAAAAADGVRIDGAASAWQRMLGGLVCTVIAERVGRVSVGEPPTERAVQALAPVPRTGRVPAAWWLLGSALLGPILGLSAYQRALVDLPGATLQAVVALTPVAVIPLAWWIDGDRPGWRGVLGGLLACAAAAGLTLAR